MYNINDVYNSYYRTYNPLTNIYGYNNMERNQSEIPLYIKDYVVYIKPEGSQHFLTEFELSDRMYETIANFDSSINSTIGAARDMEEIVLAENQYFVLADNRVSSVDSRLYGPVDISQLKGKAILRFFPFSNFDSLL